MTELLPPEQPKIKGYTFSIYPKHQTPFRCTVLASCAYVAKDVLKQQYDGCTLVYENVSDVILQHQGMLVLDVETKEITEDTTEELKEHVPEVETCVTLQDIPILNGETNGRELN